MEESLDIQFWAIRKREGRKRPWELRWRVGENAHSRSFLTKALAQGHQSKLTQAAKVVGQEWDAVTGEPLSWARKQALWFDHVVELVSREWATASANTRRGTARDLTDITMLMLETSVKARRNRPCDKDLRAALNSWAFVPGRCERETVPDRIAAALAWLKLHTRPVSALADDTTLRELLAGMATLQNGKQAAAAVVRHRRAVLHRAFELGVSKKLFAVNPLPAIKSKRRQVSDEEISPVTIPDGDQVTRLLGACLGLTGRQARVRGPRLRAFFAVMYYAGCRPAEVAALREGDCLLPATGWGRLTLCGSAPYVGGMWTDSGEDHEQRGLKHRSRKAVRVVPIPPVLVAILREHITTHGTADDGRLFWDGLDRGQLGKGVYASIWLQARKATFTAAEYASPVARRPYDLRHANASTLLSANVNPLEVAKRLGHTVKVLFAVYAHWIETDENAANARIEAAFNASDITAVTRANVLQIDGPPTGQMPDIAAA
ncbi:site-specific integrase [Acrocarpospora pleiomorpha]|uniref:Site-specific integrase n=1 Tax=Acrocarpospora pleiomorpha TaxID=90975 RepID=A0A5M3XL66_9ACTN|nr:site-specific integrase [Acrocarpospora pleiomorpha]GES22157.1 site-specific integrase [Acrocarpospora pleiomorpha]